jgi:aminopeptidase N
MPQKLVCGSIVALLAAAIVSSAPAPEPERLPSGISPLHYDLALVPDAANLRFRGRVRITIDVQTSTPAIVLNADKLTLDKATLDTNPAAAAIALDAKLQQATLTFAQPVAPGRHTLTIDYHAVIGFAPAGLFAMDYDTPAGKRRTIATNFEPSSERRFMPSWDEPALKATFSISVDLPADRMAVANMPIASTENLANGQKRVHFATTPKMSTYLVFVGIGDFERITTKVDGIDVGVVLNRGDAEKGRYALGEAARLLHYYNEYFGIRYPLPKLDLVAAPGSTGSSMENWGAILYSQDHVLFDPKSSTESERQGVFSVVAHEMAHQWFGDLVTMAWWDNLWLNEAFASWMQTKADNDLHPEWKTRLQALTSAEAGKHADAQPSTHPIVRPVLTVGEAEQSFDSITYNKGSAVIAMLETYVGPSAFRDGVRRYMHAHAYANTVDADLWREVQAAAGKPVLDVEADFTRQAGLPLLKVEAEPAKDGEMKLALTEGRFTEDPSTIAPVPAQTWRIPIAVSAAETLMTQLLSGSAPTTLTVQSKGPVIVNAGQSSFVRTLYPHAMIQALGDQIASIKPVDQLGLLYDTWAFGQSGYAPVTTYLDLARTIPLDADPLVWRQIVSTLVSIDRLYQDRPDQAAFETFARDRLHPLAARLGWDAQANEEPNAAILRQAVLVALSRFGDEPVIAEARRRFDIGLRNPQEVSPAVRRTALLIVARHADAQTLDRLIASLRATQDPLVKQNTLEALAVIADPSGAQRVMEFSVSPDAPAGAAVSVFISVAVEHPDLAWNFALQHVDQPGFPIDPITRQFLLPAIAGRSNDRKRAGDLQTYADQHFPSNARESVESAISSINLHVKFRAERIPEIDAWLAKQPAR